MDTVQVHIFFFRSAVNILYGRSRAWVRFPFILGLLLLLPATAFAAEQRPSTMPVKTSAMAKSSGPASVLPALPKKRPSSSTVGGASVSSKKQAVPQSEVRKGFCSDPFALTHRAPPVRPQDRAPVHYGPEGKKEDAAASRVTVKAKKGDGQDNRLIPQRAPFSGGNHTLPHMNKEPSPEVTVGYKHNEQATTAVVVNPQNANSPLYRPAEQEGLLNSAGVYMDVEVKPDVHFQMGGEYSSDASSSQYSSSQRESSQGAALGMRWDF